MRAVIWPFIILVKLFVTRFYFLEVFIRKLGFFSPGDPKNANRSLDIFLNYYEYYYQICGMIPKNIIEIGPGQNDFGMIGAASKNIKNYFMIDPLPLLHSIQDKEFNLSKLKNLVEKKDLEKALFLKKKDQYKYFTGKTEKFREIRSNSIDFIFSHSVLQHIYLSEVDNVLFELARISKVGCIQSHHVDLKDCISGELNNLRFSNKIWESNAFQKGGFYTNRIRLSEWINKFNQFGFEVISIEKKMFDKSPIKINSVSKDLRVNISESDLDVSNFRVTLIGKKSK